MFKETAYNAGEDFFFAYYRLDEMWSIGKHIDYS
jgi:hypothetical protein